MKYLSYGWNVVCYFNTVHGKILFMVVTRILGCQINATSRQGIKLLEISFGSIFLLFSNESSQGPHS